MPVNIILLIILSFASAPSLAQSENPECVYQSSDPDGDGYGFENNTTCLVTDNSSTVGGFSSNECIDDNADGWGWNGTSSCQVPIVPTDCVDTDPVGDGWGWDGSTSCRVVPASDTFNEIDEIEEHLGDQISLIDDFITRAAAIHCESFPLRNRPERTYYLYYNGSGLTDDGFRGTWGTGISLVDGTITATFSQIGRVGGVIFVLEEDSVIRGTRDFPDVCEWIEPQ